MVESILAGCRKTAFLAMCFYEKRAFVPSLPLLYMHPVLLGSAHRL